MCAGIGEITYPMICMTLCTTRLVGARQITLDVNAGSSLWDASQHANTKHKWDVYTNTNRMCIFSRRNSVSSKGECNLFVGCYP